MKFNKTKEDVQTNGVYADDSIPISIDPLDWRTPAIRPTFESDSIGIFEGAGIEKLNFYNPWGLNENPTRKIVLAI